MRLTLLHIAAAFCLGVAHLEGLLLLPFISDPTGISIAIVALLLVGIVQAFRARWKHVARIADLLPSIGMLGTIIGFLIMLKSGADSGDLSGVYTALYTTLLGLMGAEWLKVCGWNK